MWHLDCERAKGSGIAVAGSLPPQDTKPIFNKIRPSSENYMRNGK